MNAGTNHASAFAHGSQSCRDERADRRINDRAIKRLRRRLVRTAGPARAETSRKDLPFYIAGRRERIDIAALPARDLRDDVGGGAKTVEPDVFAQVRR